MTTKLVLEPTEIDALMDLNDGIMDEDLEETYASLSNAGLAVEDEGEYLLTIAGECVVSAVMEKLDDDIDGMRVTISFPDDELYAGDAEVEVEVA